MILTKDVRLQLDSQNELYGNITYKYHRGGSVQTKRRYQTSLSHNQNILKTNTKYNLAETQNLRKFSFLTQSDQLALNLKDYLHTDRFHIITPDTKYNMRVVLKQVAPKDERSPDQRHLQFNPYKKQSKTEYVYYILNASACPDQNMTENYLNDYGEPCFQRFDYNVVNEKQICSNFVVCSFVGNNTFEVDAPYREELQKEDLQKEDTPLVLFNHQVEEILQ